MKKKTIYPFFVAILLCLPTWGMAQKFTTGGIAYQVLSETDHTVEVIRRSNPYVGSFNIPATVTYNNVTYDVVALGYEAFHSARIYSLTIPSSVTEIKYCCFFNAQVPATINIPASVTQIAELAFASVGLQTINVDADNPVYRSIEGVLYSKDSTTLWECPMEQSGAFVVPQQTTRIASYAFAYCDQIPSMTLHEGLVSIGEGAFIFNRLLTRLDIPASVSHIGVHPFGGCQNLDTIAIADNNRNYCTEGLLLYSLQRDTLLSCHKSADTVILPNTLRVVSGFYCNNNIKYIQIPEGVTALGYDAFNSSSLQSIDMPTHLERIGNAAFSGCGELTHVGMPGSLDTMGFACFLNCYNLVSIDIPSGLRTIPVGAFGGCMELAQVNWNNEVELIDSSAFAACPVVELHFPASLRIIRWEAFNSLFDDERSITFSAPVDTLESEAFSYCHIPTLYLENTIPPVTMDLGCFYNSTVDTIWIPCGSLDAYLADSYWSQFADKYYENDNCEGIADGQSDADAYSVYPNPASDRLTVGGIAVGKVELFDRLGRLAAAREKAECEVTLEVGGLERGIYFLRLQGPDGTAVRKVVLQ